jgi:uncharacterized phage protein gp47/JayE
VTDLADLLTPDTPGAVKARLLAGLRTVGFPVDSWSAFSVPRALLEVFSTALADVTLRIANVAKLGFLRYARGDWLTVLAREVYDVERSPAVATVGAMQLAAAATAGPYDFAPGDFVAAAPNGLLYRNRDAATLPRGGTLAGVIFVAESPGAAYDLVPAGAPITLATPMPGVTIANPADPSTGTWIVLQGADEESDESLRARCAARWSTLGAGGNDDAYAYWARSASPEIVRVRVRSAYRLPGQVTIVVAGASGPASSGAIAAAQALIDPPSHLGKAPNCVDVFVVGATPVPVTVAGTVTVEAGKLDVARAGVFDALGALQGALDIGGVVRRAKVIEVVMDQAGVIDVELSSPAANVAIADDAMAVLAPALAWVEA